MVDTVGNRVGVGSDVQESSNRLDLNPGFQRADLM